MTQVIVCDDFLPADLMEEAARAFPDERAFGWRCFDNEHGRKLEMRDVALMPSVFRDIVELVNEPPALFGFDDLFADPALYGGGLNLVLPGGFLAPHADFNWNEDLKAYRTVNMLLYFNDYWIESDGGALEFFENGQSVKKVAPLFNRAVLFPTTSSSIHGYGPVKRPRRSMGFYFYRKEPAEGVATAPHRTVWQ